MIGPEDGYGHRRTPGPEQVPRRELPRSLHLEVGKALALARPGQPPVQVWVTRIQGSRVWLDADHPLAGRTLTVEAEVVEVRLATPEEVERGSVDPPPVRRA